MVAGAIATGWGDLDFYMLGYVLAIVSCCLQALYLVLTSHNSDLGLDTFCMCAAVGLVCGPIKQLLHTRFVNCDWSYYRAQLSCRAATINSWLACARYR
jgi:drug/metabolite transporter (DMT)-like permease